MGEKVKAHQVTVSFTVISESKVDASMIVGGMLSSICQNVEEVRVSDPFDIPVPKKERADG